MAACCGELGVTVYLCQLAALMGEGGGEGERGGGGGEGEREGEINFLFVLLQKQGVSHMSQEAGLKAVVATRP